MGDTDVDAAFPGTTGTAVPARSGLERQAPRDAARRPGRHPGRWTAALLATVSVLAGCTSTTPTVPSDIASRALAHSPSPTGVSPSPSASGDAIMHSDNITHVANVPNEAPFNGPQSWGTDLAFQGDHAYVGNYDGFTVVDIADPEQPKVVTRVACAGGQNDVAVWGNLLFLSVDDPRSDESCASGPGDASQASSWEGVRIFDISDKTRPKYLTAVKTPCGSHTHTLVPGKTRDTVYVYVSSSGPSSDTPNCRPPHDSLTIVKVPVNAPKEAAVVATPNLFLPPSGRESSGGCHDITAYPDKNLAAAACLGDGYLLDISNPARPQVLQTVSDTTNFSVWHSATFNDAGTKVVFGDEMGGGLAPTCTAGSSPTKGADAVYEITPTRTLVRHGYFKISRVQSETENCVAHNGSLIPVPGRDIMVQAWYQGGVSVWDFTDSDNPREIGYFERGPLTPGPQLGGSWSAYYYNGYIYSSDITKGLDILRIDDPLTDPAKKIKMRELNAQTQEPYGKN